MAEMFKIVARGPHKRGNKEYCISWISVKRRFSRPRHRSSGLATRRKIEIDSIVRANQIGASQMRILRLLAAFTLGAALQGQPDPFDVLIRNGRVVDGSGNPWYYADLGICGDTIAAMGKLGNAGARRVIDATGLTVVPGFIDMHSHSDYTLLVDGRAESKVHQGVTTEILGESESAAPVFGAGAEAL